MLPDAPDDDAEAPALPAPRTAAVTMDAPGNRFELRTPFVYTELRAGRTVSLPGVAWHHLVVDAGALKMRLKRVDLLHADQPLPAVEFYL